MNTMTLGQVQTPESNDWVVTPVRGIILGLELSGYFWVSLFFVVF